jgi:hypothetical protein
MLVGSTAGYIARSSCKADNVDEDGDVSMNDGNFDLMDADTNDADGELVPGTKDRDAGKERLHDSGPVDEPQSLSSIVLASRVGMLLSSFPLTAAYTNCYLSERKYPRHLDALAHYISEPGLPLALSQFLYSRRHPQQPTPDDVIVCVNFMGKIHVFHSAISRFYSPSDLCGAGGIYRQRIRCNPSWYGHPGRDTIFVVQD